MCQGQGIDGMRHKVTYQIDSLPSRGECGQVTASMLQQTRCSQARLPALPGLPGGRQGKWGSTDAEAGVPSTEASGAICVQRLDDSRNSAIHIKYRISLRSSSLREPRYPLLRVVSVVWISSDGHPSFSLSDQRSKKQVSAGRGPCNLGFGERETPSSTEGHTTLCGHTCFPGQARLVSGTERRLINNSVTGQ